VGNACGLSGLVLYSGGAKGVDTLSMEAALEASGTAVGVLADSPERAIRSHEAALQRGDLCLVTPYSPNAGFSVGTKSKAFTSVTISSAQNMNALRSANHNTSISHLPVTYSKR